MAINNMTGRDLSAEFWAELGLDPLRVEKAIITIEADKFVKVEVTQSVEMKLKD